MTKKQENKKIKKQAIGPVSGANTKIRKENGKNGLPLKIKGAKTAKQPSPKEQAKIAPAIQKELMNIYKDETGLPDMSKLERKKSHRLRNISIIVMAVLLLIAGATWLGLAFFGGINKFSGDNINVEIQGPHDFTSGEEIIYIIKYSNREKLPISRIEIFVQYPQGFIFKSAEPQATNENNNQWSLGTLAKGGEGEIKITGRLLGNIDSDKTITAYFDYRPANFNSDFQEVANFNTRISSSVIDVELGPPEEIIAGEPAEFTIKYKNNFQESFKNLKIILFKPDDFKLESSSPEISEEGSVWLIKELIPAEEQKIDFIGIFSSDIEGSQEMIVQIELQNDEGEWYLQQEKNFIVEVLKGELIVNLIINGSDDNQTINFGDTLNYSLVYKNKGKTAVKDLIIQANLVGNLIDWETFKDENGGKKEGSKIIWTSEEIKELALAKKDDEGVINWQIKIRERSDFKEEESIDSSLMSWVTIGLIIGEEEGSRAQTSITSKTIINELNSDLHLGSRGRYFNDDNIAVGSGPIPPEVGKPTTYRILWELTNSVHEVSNIKVKTVLPGNVYWTGKSVVGAGQLNFNVNTREIIWSINRLPLTVRKLESSFEVSITPAAEDEGTSLVLIPETTLEAYDRKTGEQIFSAAGAIDTNLEGDPVVEGKGIVIE